MPSFLSVKVSSLQEKHGHFSTPSISTAASTASPTSKPEDDNAMLVRKQGEPLHLPPGSCPTCTGSRTPTKTQVQVERKVERAIKLKAKEDEKLTTAPRKIKLKVEKQEKAILLAKERAAKATACAELMRLKLDKAKKGNANNAGIPIIYAPPESAHSHKKSKGTSSSLTVSGAKQQRLYQSPQRKTATANKRVSVCSPTSFQAEVLSVSSNSKFDSIIAGVLTIGDDTSSEGEDDNSDSGQEFRLTLARACKHGVPSQPRGSVRHRTPQQAHATIAMQFTNSSSSASNGSGSALMDNDDDSMDGSNSSDDQGDHYDNPFEAKSSKSRRCKVPLDNLFAGGGTAPMLPPAFQRG